MQRNTTATRSPFFERLKAGLEDAIQFVRGKRKLVVIKTRPRPLGAQEILRLRHNCGLSQSQFARILKVTPQTVQAWEDGLRNPSPQARHMMEIMGKHPTMARQNAAANVSVPSRANHRPRKKISNRKVSKRLVSTQTTIVRRK